MQTTPALPQSTRPFSSAAARTEGFAGTGLIDPTLRPGIRHRNRVAADGSLAAPTRLEDGDRPAALAHFLRLSEADRHMRFLQVMTDHAIDSYVTQIDFSKAMCFGVFDAEDRLVAFAEAIPYRSGVQLMAEAAFSTDEAWRRNGLARKLCESLGEYATSVGVDRVVLHCHRRNTPMRGLLRAIDAVTNFDEGDLEAEWDPTL
ncbi:MAG TPA: GNAT family N-acetyltransferase [Polyangia bacterium]